MLEIKSIQIDVQNFIAKDKLKSALQLITAVVEEEEENETSSDLNNSITLLLRRIYELGTQEIVGNYNEKIQIEKNRIAKAVQNLSDRLDELSEKAIRSYDLKNNIHYKILVIGQSPAQRETMKRIFSNRKYHSATEHYIDDEPMLDKDLKKYDIVIYNNRPKPPRGGIPTLLASYIKLCGKLDIPLLYFGHNIPVLNDDKYLDTVYFSNSKFSIHSRIEELLLYLKSK